MIDNDCRGLICLVSSTGALGTAGQLNYAATKAAVAVMPKVITASFSAEDLPIASAAWPSHPAMSVPRWLKT